MAIRRVIMKRRGDGTNQTSPNPSEQKGSRNIPDGRTLAVIAKKAYELYERRGREDGHDLEDWLKAEGIVNGRIE
jgi:hypothetical protein